MNKSTARTLISLLCGLILFALIPWQIASAAETLRLTFDSSTFSASAPTGNTWSGGTSNGWDIISEGSNKVARLPGYIGGSSIVRIGDTAWTDYTYSTKVKIETITSTAPKGVGIVGRFKDTNNLYALVFVMDTSGNKKLILTSRPNSSSYIDLSSVAFNFQANTWYTMALSFQGTSIKAYIDGELKLSATDSSVTAGQAGFLGYGKVYYDDMLVNDSSVPVPVAPGALNATSAAGQATLTWQPPVDSVGVAGYKIFRDGVDLTPTDLVKGTAYTDNSVTASASYSYMIKAVNAVGVSSALSNQVHVTIPQGQAVLTAVTVKNMVPMMVGQQLQSVAEATYSDNTTRILSSGVAFNSTVPSVAAVDPAGKISALSPGTTVITATYGGMTSPGVTLSVKGLQSISLSGLSPMAVNQKLQSVITGQYTDNTTTTLNNGVTYSSSNPNIADISSSGLVTAKSSGSTVITATYGNLTPVTYPLLVRGISIIASEDSYVYGGLANGNLNFGTGPTNKVKYTTSDARLAYYKFDLPVVDGRIDTAQLKIYVDSLDSNSVTGYDIQLQLIEDNSWKESTITYNNQPQEEGTFIQTVTVDADKVGQYLTFDVSDAVKSRTNGKVSFRVAGVTSGKGGNYVTKEHADSSKHPTLILSTMPSNGEPGMPVNFGAAAQSSGEIKLVWSEVSDATGYTVKRSTVNGGPYTNIAVDVQGASYTDSGLVAGKKYYYVIVAVNANGEGNVSKQAAASTFTLEPDDLAAVPGNEKIKLTWEAPEGTASFNIKRSTASGGPYQLIASNVIGKSYLDTLLKNGVTYYYVISGVNAQGESLNSVEVSATPIWPVSLSHPMLMDFTGKPLTDLKSADFAKVSMDLSNRDDHDVSGQLSVLLYRSDGTLAGSSSVHTTLAIGQTTAIRMGISIPSNADGYYVSIRMVDSVSGNKLLLNELRILKD